MEIISVEEQEDGSALVQVDFTADEIQKLIETALIIGLTEGLIKMKEEKLNDLQSKTDLGNARCGNPDCVYGSGEQSSKPEQLDLFPETLEVSGGQ